MAVTRTDQMMNSLLGEAESKEQLKGNKNISQLTHGDENFKGIHQIHTKYLSPFTNNFHHKN